MGTALLAFQGRSLIGRKLLLGQRLRRDDGKSLCKPLSLGPGHFGTETQSVPLREACRGRGEGGRAHPVETTS